MMLFKYLTPLLVLAAQAHPGALASNCLSKCQPLSSLIQGYYEGHQALCVSLLGSCLYLLQKALLFADSTGSQVY